MAEINDLDPTDASNTSIGGINSQGSTAPSNIDNVIRAVAGMLGRMKSGAAAVFDTMTWCDPSDTTKKFRFDGVGITAGNTRVITIPDANLTLPTSFYSPSGTDVALADGGTGASLADPNADRIMFWDDSGGAVTWLVPNTGLAISGTNLNFSFLGLEALSDPNADRIAFWDDSEGAFKWLASGTGLSISTTTLGIDKASDAEVRSSASNKFLSADLVESASAIVSLTDAATVAVDWDSFINADVTLTASRALGNPTNVQAGTFRTITVKGNNSTDRTLTFGSNYEGDIPTLTDIDDGKWYLLTLFALTTSHIVVSSATALKP